MPHFSAFFALLSTLLFITPSPAALSQDTPAAPDQAPLAQPPSTEFSPNRELLARWYLRVDAAWSKALAADPAPTDAQIAQTNKEFDRASLAFFRLAIPEAIGILRDLEQTLSGKPPIQSPLLSLQIEPRTWTSAPRRSAIDTVSTITLSTLQTPTSDATLEGDLTLTMYSDFKEILPTTFSTTTTHTLNLKAGTQFSHSLTDYKYFSPFFVDRVVAMPVRIEVSFTPKGGSPVTDWLIIPNEIHATERKNNQSALDEAKATISPLTYSLFKSRNNLLVNNPSRNSSSQFLARYETLAKDLKAELARIKKGYSPYPLRDRWFASFPSGSTTLPLWINTPTQSPHVPASYKEKPLPLLILLHGAGGDESMFFFGYGQGIYPKLGVEAGMVVVAPNTMQMLSVPGALTDLITNLSELYAIDPTRIYLVGHSMGAAAASTLAQRHPETIAAYACLAGGQLNATKPTPPALFIAGALDPIIPIDRIKSGISKALEAGQPITYIEKPHHGHTLIVSDHAQEVIDFLKVHQRKP